MEREDPSGALRWHFNGCVLDESSLQLSVRGAVVELERKPLEVLRYLLRHAGEVVTKDEVLEAVWPGRILSDTVLAKAISRLREVLGETAADTLKTVHGYGYRLVAEVRVEQHTTPVPKQASLGLQRGDHPPLRPNWVLVAHLESGGRGEVWRVQHEKNSEQRVLKFALDDAALTSLKREITLNRLLRQSLGEQAAVTQLLDWNLQQPPFFIELPYLPQGSLADWAAAAGGLALIPLTTRLDVAAQIAEAVSAAHGVGVLHKDLKPANVLVTGAAENPLIQLTDFGSGAVMEQAQLDALGITRMGLTQSIGGSDSTSGTPLYFAPEVLAGQPHTVRSDNYALGVLLYQLSVGDFKKPLSPGWERDIADPLLREDIAAAADGNPVHRLGDAEELAKRLRTLEARRIERTRNEMQHAAEQRALEAAAHLQRDNERLRTRRSWMTATVFALALGLVASLVLYRQSRLARDEALMAAATAEAVTSYFTDDIIDVVQADDIDVKTLSIEQLFERLALRVDSRLDGQPEVEARVRMTLAAVFELFADTRETPIEQIKKAFQKVLEVAATQPVGAVGLLKRMEDVNFLPALSLADIAALDAVLDRAEQEFGDPANVERRTVATLRKEIARDVGLTRDNPVDGLKRLDALLAGGPMDADLAWEVKRSRAALLKNLGRPRDALAQYQQILADPKAETFAGGTFYLARMKAEIGSLLLEVGEPDAAEPLILGFAAEVLKGMREDSGASLKTQYQLSLLRLAQGRTAEAIALLDKASPLFSRRIADAALAEVPLYAEAKSLRVDAQLLAGHTAQALMQSREGLQEMTSAMQRVGSDPTSTPYYVVRLRHIDALAAAGEAAAARTMLVALPAAVLDKQPPQSLLRAERLRVEGAVLRAEGDATAARHKLADAEAMLVQVFGAQSWRVKRVQLQLASTPS